MLTTIGHSEAYGGLRGHSIGDIYPMIVVAKGDGKWYVHHPWGGLNCIGFATAAEAYKAAQSSKRSFLIMKACFTVLSFERG